MALKTYNELVQYSNEQITINGNCEITGAIANVLIQLY